MWLFCRRWYYNRNQREEPVEDSSGHYVVRDGSLIIQGVQESDGGSYMCTASNSEGSESMEVRLTVSAPLNVHVQPSIQTVDLGKAAHLVIDNFQSPSNTFFSPATMANLFSNRERTEESESRGWLVCKLFARRDPRDNPIFRRRPRVVSRGCAFFPLVAISFSKGKERGARSEDTVLIKSLFL